jgi:UDP-2,3-diacylglucosamine pyrophosphatase LpxH
MHERLLECLASRANVRLVASFRHDQLGFPGDTDLLVILPDMHVLSHARRAAFRYGLNQEELLVDVLGGITGLKTAAAEDESVEVIHIGDYLDLWRESQAPGAGADIPRRIKQDHPALVAALESEDLDASFLLGNHDFDLYRWANYSAWERRYFLPADIPQVLILHGDYFDLLERVPEDVKEFFVYFVAKDPGQYQVGKLNDKMAALTRRENAKHDYRDHLRLPQPARVGAMQAAAGAKVPEEWNIQREGADGASVEFLNSAYDECMKANREFGLKLRTVIIGHTHHARIAVKTQADGSPFTLIDSGAWLEKCVDDAGGVAPNAQITALSANEVRIYQLAPPGV